MDGDMKQLRSRVRFAGVGQEDQGGRDPTRMPSQQSTRISRGIMSNKEEYDASYAATVAAVAYAIAARDDEKILSEEKSVAEKIVSGKKPVREKLGWQNKPVSINERQAAPPLKSPTKRGEILKRPNEGSKISKWLSGKDPIDDDYDDEQGANVSVRRPLKPAQKKPQGLISDQKVPSPADLTAKSATEKFTPRKKPEKLGWQNKPASIDESQAAPPLESPTKRGEILKRPTEGSKISKWLSGKEPTEDDYGDEQGANVSLRRPLKPAQRKPQGIIPDQNMVEKVADYGGPSIKKDPSFARRAPDKKGSRIFEKDQLDQKVPSPAPPARPMSSYSSGASGVATSGMAISNEAESMADAWEKEKLANIKRKYNETMETIAEWEAEKKAKARRQKQLKDESDSERRRAKALEEYNEEMARINKVAAASRLTAEEKRSNAERKVREKAWKIRSTGKLPPTCGCF